MVFGMGIDFVISVKYHIRGCLIMFGMASANAP